MPALPSEIADSPTANLKFNPADPETAKKVSALMAELRGDKDPAALAKGDTPPPVAENPRMHVPPNTDFDIPIPGDRIVQEALASPSQMTVTEEEKTAYLRALLTDTPMRLTLPLYGGRLSIELRARYNHEQRRIFDVLTYEQTKGIMPKDNPAFAFNRIQLFCAVLMVERLNGQLVSDLVLKPGCSLEEDQAMMSRVVVDKFESMTMGLWMAVLQAMKTFEYKCARMNEEALNEGFWSPRGPVV